jgi:LmbE family N-acetylglucosaminyl deacetylase
MPAVILSPHLDDAVLSCWHLLTQPSEVAVINVFAGVPTDLGAPAWWDEYTGASDSAERVRERIEEDRRALAVAGRTAVNLGFLDEQYRPDAQPLAPLTEQIERLLDSGVGIYAPAAFANHADHALVRAAALQLRAAGFEVSLYADLPHATVRGWPAWVSGKAGPIPKDLAGALWDRVLATTAATAPTVHRFDPASHARKLVAVRMYGTQLQALQDFAGRPLGDPEVLGCEVIWPTAPPPPAVRSAGHRRSGPRSCDR